MRRLLFWLARSPWSSRFIGWVFENAAVFIPLKRLYLSDAVIAFVHPRPAYPVHVLLVPRKAIPSLAGLIPADAAYLLEILRVAEKLARQLGLSQSGYQLIQNNGAYQDVPQVHFHLIAGPVLLPV